MVLETAWQKLPEEINWDYIKQQLTNRTVQLGILTGGLISYYLYKQLTKKRYKLPPGPFPLPLIGNLHNTGYSSLHLSFTKLSKIYGPIFTVYLGPIRAVVLNNAKVTREAYLQKGPEFAGRAKTWSALTFSDNGRDISLSQYTPVWKLQRKIAHTALRKYASKEKMEVLVEDAFTKITSEIDKAQGPIDPTDYLCLFVYNVFASMCFGREFEMDDPFIVKNIEMNKFFTESGAASQLALIDSFPFLSHDLFGLKGAIAIKTFMAFYKSYIEEEFDRHLSTYEPNSLRDFVDEVIFNWKQAQLEKDDTTVLSQLTRRHCEMVIFDIFAAGTDTTRINIAWVLLYLAKYPEIQKKAHNEVQTVLGNRKPNIRVRDELHYLYAVLHEVMRIAPVVGAGLPHITTCDTTLGGYDIPKDTMVFSNAYGIHNDPTEYEEPDKFNPDRWLDNNGKINLQAPAFVPFSIGTRSCIGESLARVEIMMTLAFFIQTYEFLTPPGVDLDDEPVDYGGSINYKPYKIFFKKRY